MPIKGQAGWMNWLDLPGLANSDLGMSSLVPAKVERKLRLELGAIPET